MTSTLVHDFQKIAILKLLNASVPPLYEIAGTVSEEEGGIGND